MDTAVSNSSMYTSVRPFKEELTHAMKMMAKISTVHTAVSASVPMANFHGDFLFFFFTGVRTSSAGAGLPLEEGS